MERWSGRVALVTGASVGIGAALCRALVKHGMRVVGCGRNLEKLQELGAELSGPGSFLPIKCDLSDEDDITRMFKLIKDDCKGVDVCINNAGMAHSAPLLSGDSQQWRDMLEELVGIVTHHECSRIRVVGEDAHQLLIKGAKVNVIGLCVCTQLAIKSMRNRKIDDGHVINISSMSGHRVVPSRNTHFYSATKFAVRALTDGLRNELREIKSSIRITEISPGVVETEFAKRMTGEKAAEKLYSSMKCLQPEDIADAVVYALSAPPHVQVHDVLMRPTEQVS